MFTTNSGAAFGWSVAKSAERPGFGITKAPGVGTPHADVKTTVSRPIISADTPALMAS
jgi:hypothetical protein